MSDAVRSLHPGPPDEERYNAIEQIVTHDMSMEKKDTIYRLLCWYWNKTKVLVDENKDLRKELEVNKRLVAQVLETL